VNDGPIEVENVFASPPPLFTHKDRQVCAESAVELEVQR
jgi:hypothetical protein